MKLRYLPVFLLSLLLFQGCGGEPEPILTELPSPARGASELPHLHASDSGGLYLSWVEHAEAGDSVTLRQAAWEGNGWGAPQTVTGGADWFVNWADYPSVVAGDGGPLAAHWLRKVPGNRYSYEVRLSLHGPDGWGPPLTPHNDGTATEHGFVSLLPWDGGSVLALWLDGRRTADRAEDEYFDMEKAMTLRSAVVAPDGTVSGRSRIDEAICDCCQTSLARIPGGAIAAYRDRLEGEIRDISVSRYLEGSWSEPVRVHEDGWNISACPVNGPALATSGSTVVVAWYTGAGGEPRVKAAVSTDAGATFGDPVTVDLGAPMGRVDAAIADNGSIYVSWMEESEGQQSSFMVRELAGEGYGTPSEAITVADMSASRSSGFPRMSASGDGLVFAWTGLEEEGTRLHTAVMRSDR